MKHVLLFLCKYLHIHRKKRTFATFDRKITSKKTQIITESSYEEIFLLTNRCALDGQCCMGRQCRL